MIIGWLIRCEFDHPILTDSMVNSISNLIADPKPISLHDPMPILQPNPVSIKESHLNPPSKFLGLDPSIALLETIPPPPSPLDDLIQHSTL